MIVVSGRRNTSGERHCKCRRCGENRLGHTALLRVTETGTRGGYPTVRSAS
jgi:hypothetical protein